MSRVCDDAMREDQLVDDVAKRMCEALQAELPSLYERVPCGFDSRSIQAVARECIRQMRWAEQAAWTARRDYVAGGEPDIMGPLTLAPPDWQP